MVPMDCSVWLCLAPGSAAACWTFCITELVRTAVPAPAHKLTTLHEQITCGTCCGTPRLTTLVVTSFTA